MTPYACYACAQGQFAHYCHGSASPFEVCPYLGATPYMLCLRARAIDCCASASLFECVLKLQRVNCTTVVVTRIPDFAAYIIDWTATVVLFDMII